MTINCIFNKAHENEIYRYDYAIIYFSASWCNPCKHFFPIFSQIADNHKHLNFFKVDIDESPEFTEKFNITHLPTIIILKKGEKINEVIGIDENKLLSILYEL
jgi:thioredoxin 1